MTDLLQLGGKMLLNTTGAGNSSFEPLDQESHRPMMHQDDAEALNTLDEPVSETIKRDLDMIKFKLKYVLNPHAREEGAKGLRDWDLWGPLVLCLALAFVLSMKASNDADTIFGTIFIIVWGGASVLTLNAKFLGAEISFFQSVCVLGYCIFPILIGAVGITVVEFLFELPFIINMGICGFAFFWAFVSSVGFMGQLVPEDKKVLAVYPVLLFYLSLSWYVLIAASS